MDLFAGSMLPASLSKVRLRISAVRGAARRAQRFSSGHAGGTEGTGQLELSRVLGQCSVLLHWRCVLWGAVGVEQLRGAVEASRGAAHCAQRLAS